MSKLLALAICLLSTLAWGQNVYPPVIPPGASLLPLNNTWTGTNTYVNNPTFQSCTAGYTVLGGGASPISCVAFTSTLLGPNANNLVALGADPTGAADSSAAFNSAVAACKTQGGSVSPGCRIFIPPGQYLFNSTGLVNGSNILVECASNATLIINGMSNHPAIEFGDGVTQYNRSGIINCAFGQSGSVTAVAGNVGLNVVDESNFTADNIQTYNFPGALYIGIALVTVSQSFLSKIGVQSSLYDGIDIILCADLYVTQARSDANGHNGWSIENTTGAYFEQATGYNNTASAWVFFYPGSGVHNKNIFCWECVGDTSGLDNWSISDLYQSTFTSIWAATQQSTPVNTFATGILMYSSNVYDVDFVGGKAVWNNSHGVYIQNAGGLPQRITFTGFVFGDKPAGNGRAGSGYGLNVDNASGAVNVVGGAANGNTSGAVNAPGSGVSITALATTW